jgi:hypothetical protein
MGWVRGIPVDEAVAAGQPPLQKVSSPHRPASSTCIIQLLVDVQFPCSVIIHDTIIYCRYHDNVV